MAKELTIVTWNVNSLRVRLEAVTRWVEEHQPDALCLQETKVQDEQFPLQPIQALGYQAAFWGQKTYNGVAILTRQPLQDVRLGFEGKGGPDARLMAGTLRGVRIVNAYVPHGSEPGSPKFAIKMEFYQALRAYFERWHKVTEPLVLVGDLNVAPEPRDVFSVEEMEGQIGFHPDERAALTRLRDWGFVDEFRHFHEEAGHYTWWDYRAAGFRRNRGLRIDHVYATPALSQRAQSCWIDREERAKEKASDHTPLVATYKE